jgi:hypothetical protein
MLHEQFFEDPVFGLEWSMENGLVAFERGIKNNEMSGYVWLSDNS